MFNLASGIAMTATRIAAKKSASVPTPSTARALLSVKNAGIALDCSRSTVLRMIASGKLRSVTLSARAVRIVAADVDALIG